MRKHEPALGTFSQLKSGAFIDALSYTGFDWVVIDMEHASLSTYEMDDLVALTEARGMSPVVRVNAVERSAVLKALDAGAHAIMVPCVKTVDDVKKLVEWGKFKPVGDRGYCPTRDCGFGKASNFLGMREYMDYCNENTIIMPQCETKDCVENIEEIVAVDGIDAIYIGPLDLSVSLGIPGEYDDPIYIDAVAKVKKACEEAGVLCLIFATSPEQAKEHIAAGYDGIAYGVDIMMLQNLYEDIANSILE